MGFLRGEFRCVDVSKCESDASNLVGNSICGPEVNLGEGALLKYMMMS